MLKRGCGEVDGLSSIHCQLLLISGIPISYLAWILDEARSVVISFIASLILGDIIYFERVWREL